LSDATHGYATAIFQIASSEGELARVADELFRISRAFESNHELRAALTDIALPIEGKEELIEKVLEGKASRHTISCLKFVIGQGKVRQLVEIADELARLAEEESQREVAEVRSAVALSDDQIKRLEESLGKATGKHVTAKVIVDPSVIGGIHARIGEVVIDGSVRHKLQLLKERLDA
jgi:F-type H+-transporting ATPase subunit delta